ncbi:hypothetical protein CCMSSC00406_0004442 [Pleurotus cornucopiae]|uniref:Uncharacterized protein n=1 Tax=Pleurotus cornucopiae TaxID=5321 RepID=A0ACB7J067_PLECO|nr:hypothetical protein CCMSSC00406_0004442 [Pleurotus cornucopiae]
MPVCVFYLGNQCKFGDKCNYSHDVEPLASVQQSMCKHFIRGNCLFGTRCRDRHSRPSDLQSNSEHSPGANGKVPRIPCKYFALGRCKSGDTCLYVHEAPASFPQPVSTQFHDTLEGRICELFGQGHCSQGSECPFLHVPGAHGADSSLNLVPDSNVEGDTDALTQANESSAGLTEEPSRKPKVIPDTQTLLCKYFAQGLCKYGDNCQFRHGGVQFFTNSSSSSPFVATTTRSTENSDEGGWTRRPTVQCKFYAEGNCIRGDACSFLHGAHSKNYTNAPRHWSEDTNSGVGANHWAYNADASIEDQETDAAGQAVGWGDSWGDNNDVSTPTAETGGDNHWASSGGNADDANDAAALGWGGSWGDGNGNGSLPGDSRLDQDSTKNDIDATALAWGECWGSSDANDSLPSSADQGWTSKDALSTAPGWGDSWGDSNHGNNSGSSNTSGDSKNKEALDAAPGWGDVDASNSWGTISTKYGVDLTASNVRGTRKHGNAEASSSKLDKPYRQGKSSKALERTSSNSNEDEARTMPSTPREVCRLYLKGTCTLGAKCQMSHDRQHPRLCRYGSQAKCPRGRKCYFMHESDATAPLSKSLNHGGQDAVGKKQAKSPARDPLPHFSRKPPWTYTLKPEDPNAAKFDDAPPTESSSSSGSGSLPTKHSIVSPFVHPPGLPAAPVASRSHVPHPREYPLPVSPLLLSPHLVSLPLSPLLPCDIPLPPSPLSPHLIPLPLSPITPPGLPYLPSPRSIPLPTSPLLNSVCDSLDGRPDAERPQGSPGHVTEETSSSSNLVMTLCHYFKQGYCRSEDRCRFLHTLEEGIDEVAHIPVERRENDEFDNQPPEPLDDPMQLPEADPVFLEMDTEPTSTMRSFFSASIRFSHRGQPSHIVTAFESSRILLANLPFHITRDDVERLVSQFGVIKGLMMLEPTPDAVAALVEFNHSEEAELAAAQLDNLAYQGRSLSARQDRRGFLQNVGTAHGGYHVRLSWNAPSRVAWAFYNSITLAKTEAAKLGTIRFDSRQIKATFERPRKNQTSAYAVKITGLPLNTDRRRLQEFCVGSTSVTIGEPTYVDDSLGPIRELLARHGTLHSLEPVPLDKENTKVVAIAQFLLAEAAASAAFNLNGLTPDIIGHNILSAQHIHLSAYTIPRREYVAIKNEFDAIKAGLGESCRIQCCDHIDPLRLYVYSEDANAYTSAKVQIERLVLGDLLVSSNNTQRWEPYLETPRGMQLLETLNADAQFFIRVDALKKQIRVLGGSADRERAKKQVNSLFSTLRKSRHRLPLPRDVIAPLLAGELQSLKELFTINNIILGVTELVLIAWGKLETIDDIRRVIRRLEASTPPINSYPHDRVVCPTCWRPPVDAITIPCGHTYCKGCLHYLILATGGSLEGARCIGQVLQGDEGGEAAFCHGDVPYSALRTILAPDEESTLLNAAFTAFVRNITNGLRFCPSPGCEVVYRKRESGIVIACPSCLSRICPSCETFYHEGISCQQFLAVSPHL